MDDNSISGWHSVVGWFGYSPNFHDSEVELITLSRGNNKILLDINAWRAITEIDNEGFFERDRFETVRLISDDIEYLELRGWNHQNVLSKLEISVEDESYTIWLDGTFGVYGKVVCRNLRAELKPKSAPVL